MFENVEQNTNQPKQDIQNQKGVEQPSDYIKKNTIAEEIAKQQLENPETIIDIDDNEDIINRKNILLIVGVLLVTLIMLTIVGFFVVRSFSEKSQEVEMSNTVIINQNTNTTGSANTNTVNTNINQVKPKVNTICGYSDLNEVVVNPSADTDQDGLRDGLEHSYGTSILNPDTDGDGYKDGEEIKNGYNPCGSGTL